MLPYIMGWTVSPLNIIYTCCFWCSGTQSCPTLRRHGLQHALPPCPSPSPGVCTSSCSLHQWCGPAISSSGAFFSFCPPSFPASGTFPDVHIRWPKYCSFSFSISPYSECSGPISLKIDCFDLLVVQGTFRSLLQHHSLKSSILWHSAFFMVQLGIS